MKMQLTPNPQAGINTMLYAVAPETRTKHSCTGFGGVSARAALGKCAVILAFFFFLSFPLLSFSYSQPLVPS
jgi:hypothetical protein